MMLFKKLAYFTDIHWGRSSNNPAAIQDNVEFIDWFIDEALSRGCETFVFGGDYFDNRHQLNIHTLNIAMDSLEKINNAFSKSYFIPGNHDLYHRQRRDISSIEVARNFKNIHLIRHPTTIDNVLFLPWLIDDEIKRVSGEGSRYVFGHLEVPGFLMNAKVEMPESAHAVSSESFKEQEYVFSGHFHMRQQKGNILYTGNVMPFNFSDVHDTERGAMFLEWGKDPEFLSWPDQPLFRTMKLSEALEHEAKLLRRKLTARITLDIEISYEEATVIRDTFVQRYGLRKMELIQQSSKPEQNEFDAEVTFQSVDQIVIDGLMSMTGGGVRSDVLVDLYKSLPSL